MNTTTTIRRAALLCALGCVLAQPALAADNTKHRRVAPPPAARAAVTRSSSFPTPTARPKKRAKCVRMPCLWTRKTARSASRATKSMAVWKT